ncbi:SCO5717 family growth-regulating ATPase, partial [Streptomyces sp. NPDC006356]
MGLATRSARPRRRPAQQQWLTRRQAVNRDRSEYNGGSPSSDGDDHEVDLTGEFEIVYTPPAWYAQSTQSGSPSGEQQDGGRPTPPPPTGSPVGSPTGPPGAAPQG